MPAAEVSRGALIASIALGVVTGLLWLLLLDGAVDPGHSDPAGDALGRAYAAIMVNVLWSLLTIMTAIASLKGSAPRLAKASVLVIVPISGWVALTAMALLAQSDLPPFRWPIVILAAVPPLAVGWCFLVLLGRGRMSRIASGALPVAILAVCLLIEPLSRMRNATEDAEDARRAKYDEDIARVPADAAMWDWTPFLDTQNNDRRVKVIDSIRRLDQRQTQAETMLDRGDFPLGNLGYFDLDPTPALCEKARRLLRKRVEPLMLKTPNSRPYSDIALQVSDAVAAMSWLVGYDCSCDVEAMAWEAMAKDYVRPNYTIHELAELRDPGRLGRTLRERPERFSMLGPKSHLKAWLKFTDDKSLRDQALAGARKLDRRMDEAVEILSEHDPGMRYTLLQYLGELDLEATVPLCTNALSELHHEIAEVYRPGPNDEPPPYSELLERLGRTEPLRALIWLARNGCAADAELKGATALVNAYRESPGRAEMLATLTQLQR
ncbi:hypothetical protein [Bradyrhizobium iriomotense]|uniref:HEAT repeat domain-containing protein n=1 Tax=Bradyrhizobium iriomotense TaxID=441950 RepID=A0ABQ6B4K2_9BRAD|nr:hypothetical protein [Bradyrhizobium iriomotense]GLR89008.1 hypothetical protein GCM10007857_57210 [Bradyrhizobium iriomotense]